MDDMKDVVAIITGGARNVGLGIAEGFAAAGAKVGIVARSQGAGEEAVALIQSAGGDAFFRATDVSNAEQVEESFQAIVDHFGGLHVLVNNAAIMEHATHAARIADMLVEHWNEFVGVNFTGPFLCTKFAVPHILASGGGAIVNIGSAAAYWANAEGAGYGVTKSGLAALTRYTAADYGPHIRCNELILGPIKKASPIYDLFESDPEIVDTFKRIMHTDRFGSGPDVANACKFLATQQSGFITGTSIWLDGGCHISSPLPDWDVIKAAIVRANAAKA